MSRDPFDELLRDGPSTHGRPQSQQRAAMLKGLAVSNKMIDAAQTSYESNPEYGISDDDMKKAIKAALDAASKEWK